MLEAIKLKLAKENAGKSTLSTASEIMLERIRNYGLNDNTLTFFVLGGMTGTAFLLMRDQMSLKKRKEKSAKTEDRLRWRKGDLLKIKQGNHWNEATITAVQCEKAQYTMDDVLCLQVGEEEVKVSRSDDSLVAVISKKDEDQIISLLVGLFEKHKTKSQLINRNSYLKLWKEAGF